ncbi:MAG: 50S ribosomal protein L32 [Candidatus Kerfeldbacteria bacterium]|nr:50S ribosomal protein L32 [Candidatus Kerfeldbacteria bacterium]
MGLPAKRNTRSSKRRRASHFALHASRLIPCDHCKKLKVPHRACPHCGYYRGREVIHTTTKLEKRKAKQKKEREAGR